MESDFTKSVRHTKTKQRMEIIMESKDKTSELDLDRREMLKTMGAARYRRSEEFRQWTILTT